MEKQITEKKERVLNLLRAATSDAVVEKFLGNPLVAKYIDQQIATTQKPLEIAIGFRRLWVAALEVAQES